MAKRVSLFVLMSFLLLSAACSTDNITAASNKPGVEINNISSSIGAVGENTKDFETQRFKYTVTLTSNDASDITIISVNPVLSEKFAERVLNKDTEIRVNKTIPKRGSLNVSGEIIFDAKGLTKEQIIGLEPFIKSVKVLEERVIDKSF